MVVSSEGIDAVARCGHTRREASPQAGTLTATARSSATWCAGGRALSSGPVAARARRSSPGGFFHVPAGLVHRDVNPTAEPQEFILVFVGTGPLVVDFDGPEAG
jgi:uncharacterized RmlC-like cupin family protein